MIIMIMIVLIAMMFHDVPVDDDNPDNHDDRDDIDQA